MVRFFDILFSFVAAVILLPFMIPVMIALKCTGEHDIFYGQERTGRGGKTFKLLKFATMLRDSPNLPGGLYTAENDPRMLPMGRFLRKTKINELPQLLNILKGDMSFIGYRPFPPKLFLSTYPEDVRKRMTVSAPGLSGIGSIVFRNEEQILIDYEKTSGRPDAKEYFHRKVIGAYKGKLEIWYAEHRSLKLYFQLIRMTVQAVLNPAFDGWAHTWKDLPPVPEELKPWLFAGSQEAAHE